jgi:hypothetical protein
MAQPRSAPVRPERRRRARSARERVGWTLLVLGALLFVASAIGARTGWTVLPFDPHHIFGQIGGAAFALLGITLINRR